MSDEVLSDIDADEEEREVDQMLMRDMFDMNSDDEGDGTINMGLNRKKEQVPPTYWEEFYRKIDEMAYSQLFLMLLTFLALFLDDFRILVLPHSADQFCSTLSFIILIVFATEFSLQAMFKRDYRFSLFFYLDLVATLSLVTDVIFLSELIFGETMNVATIQQFCTQRGGEGNYTDDVGEGELGDTGQVARAGRAARVAARTARLMRILRFLRVIRAFKIFKFFHAFGSELDNSEMELRANPTRIGAHLAEVISQRVIVVVLVLFVGTVLVFNLFEVNDDGPQAGLDWMETMTENATGSVSQFAANTYVASVPHTILCLVDLRPNGDLFRHTPDIISERRDVEVELFISNSSLAMSAIDRRDKETDRSVVNVFVVLILVMVTLGMSYVFAQDTEELVVRRISVIVESVNKMSATLKYLNSGEEEETGGASPSRRDPEFSCNRPVCCVLCLVRCAPCSLRDALQPLLRKSKTSEKRPASQRRRGELAFARLCISMTLRVSCVSFSYLLQPYVNCAQARTWRPK